MFAATRNLLVSFRRGSIKNCAELETSASFGKINRSGRGVFAAFWSNLQLRSSKMRFDRLEGYLVRLPLKQTARVADAPVDYCETVVVRLESEGCSGWSEVAPGASPTLTEEWSGATYLTLRNQIVPRVAEMKSAAKAEAFDDAFASLKGNRHAKAAIELAWQDLNARQQGVPLWKALGGEKKPLKVGLSFDRSVQKEEFFDGMQRLVDENFARATLKIRPGWDVQIVSFARVDYPAWLQLQVDVEGALDFDKHADTLYRMDDFFLNCVEQPLNPRDFVAHAMLKDALRTPVCLDESIRSLQDAEIALDVEACKVICMKPGRVGGLNEALKIAQFAQSKEVKCYAGCDLPSSLGYRSTLALASTENFLLPTDYLRFEETLECDLVEPVKTTLIEEPGDETKGKPARNFRYVELWDEPGIGVEPNIEEMAKYTLDKFVWTR